MGKPTAAPWRSRPQHTGGKIGQHAILGRRGMNPDALIASVYRTSEPVGAADSALIVAGCNAIQRFAAALDCDPVQLAEHLANAHPGAMLDKLASVFGEEEE